MDQEIYSGYEFDQESLSSQHQICVDGNIHASGHYPMERNRRRVR